MFAAMSRRLASFHHHHAALVRRILSSKAPRSVLLFSRRKTLGPRNAGVAAQAALGVLRDSERRMSHRAGIAANWRFQPSRGMTVGAFCGRYPLFFRRFVGFLAKRLAVTPVTP
jgi:hypothetical protein